jgi:hypothetical protein
MLDLSSREKSIITGDAEFYWLFYVEDSNGNTYHWAMAAHEFFDTFNWDTISWDTITWGNDETKYTFRVIPDSFKGIRFTRSKPEYGIIAPNETTFEISNSDSSLTAGDFAGGVCLINLLVKDNTSESVLAGWRFRIKRANEAYKVIRFTCQDFLVDKLRGDYPNTRLISDIWPTNEGNDFGLCVPVIFGTAYIPLQSFYHSTDAERYYMLGDSSKTFGVTRVHSFADWDTDAEWVRDDGFTFSILTKQDANGNNWKVLAPYIADADADGVEDSIGVWKSGGAFLPITAQVQDKDTLNKTNPADVIQYILEDFGIDSGNIDVGAGSTFESAKNTFNDWGLEFNGAFYSKQSRAKVLSQLLIQCNAHILVADKIELHIRGFNITGDKLIDSTKVMKGSWRFQYVTESENDSGYVAWQQENRPQDRFIKTLVPSRSEGTTDVSSGEILNCAFVSNDEHIRKLGTLYYQWKLNRKARISFGGMPQTVLFQPGDVIQINDDDYGSTVVYTTEEDGTIAYEMDDVTFWFEEGGDEDVPNKVVVNSMRIKRDLSIDFDCVYYGELYKWGNVIVSETTSIDDATQNEWSPAIQGPKANPSSGSSPRNVDLINHDDLAGFVAGEHIDHSTVSVLTSGILSGGGPITSNVTISLKHADIDHDSLSGFVANEHIDWSISQSDHEIYPGNIDGDTISIDWNPTNYTPAADSVSTAESDDHLAAHLYGIDQALSSLGGGASGTVTVVTAVAQDSAGDVTYKTRDLTINNGVITTIGSESGWTAA